MTETRVCHECDDPFGPAHERVRCETCGLTFHETCLAFHQAMDARCGSERWIGALEF
ncbi:MAG: hypothetical protein ABEJ70_01885 [Halobacteriaceae archaeon]